MSDLRRADYGLAQLLQFEHVAWFEDGKVRILDRRVYPTEIRYEICHSHTDVAQAIADMVTQSAGPYYAAAHGMTLAAWECRNSATPMESSAAAISTYWFSSSLKTCMDNMSAINSFIESAFTTSSPFAKTCSHIACFSAGSIGITSISWSWLGSLHSSS